MLTVSLVIPNHCHKYKSCDKSKTLKTKQITNFQLKQFLMMGIVWLTNQVQWNESLKNYLKLLLVVAIDWSLRKAYRSILQLMGNLGCPCLCLSPCFWVGWMISCLSFAFGPVLGCVGWAGFGGAGGACCFALWGAAVGRGVFGAGCDFRVGWRTAARVLLLFFRTFLLVLTSFSLWQGEWALK